MNFDDILAQVDQQHNAQFRQMMDALLDGGMTMKRRLFLSVYLWHFLGDIFPADLSKFDDDAFDSVCHQAIDMVSLLEPEIDFMHACVSLGARATGVRDYITAYDAVPDLPRCQLGAALKACLDNYDAVTFT